jgi:outer membrane protein assembly factor BamD (BamD/ComL family)
VLAAVLSEVKVSPAFEADVDTFLASALERHPEDVKLLDAIATLRAVHGRYDEAIKHYRTVATQYAGSPANTQARLALARHNVQL